mmetsp:Transcript_13199/g.21169  ORF Transcript_13199/g.21169 Transcript_13199/m.21169 type:complete len:232 (+) Transcript_13199:451-1146(+)
MVLLSRRGDRIIESVEDRAGKDRRRGDGKDNDIEEAAESSSSRVIAFIAGKLTSLLTGHSFVIAIASSRDLPPAPWLASWSAVGRDSGRRCMHFRTSAFTSLECRTSSRQAISLLRSLCHSTPLGGSRTSATISSRITPKEKISAGREGRCTPLAPCSAPFPPSSSVLSKASGARYTGSPSLSNRLRCRRVCCPVLSFIAIPKSPIFNLPFAAINIFAGFKSRWIIPFWWM